MNISVAVTGASSFLGQYVVRELLSRNILVKALIRPKSTAAHLYDRCIGVTVIHEDMVAVDQWLPQMGQCDYFLHLGWDGVGAVGRSNMAIQEQNVGMAEQCFLAARKIGCRSFLFSGSQAEYGPQTEVISETTPCHPVIPYGKGKLMVCERLLSLANGALMRYYHTRIFSVYGLGDHPWALLPNCISTFCDGKVMELSSCEQYWNFMHASDAARVLVKLLLSNAESGIYNIAGHDTRKLRDFVTEVHMLCGSGIPQYGTYVSSEPIASLQPDISKLEKVVGHVSDASFHEKIAEMVSYYRMKGRW